MQIYNWQQSDWPNFEYNLQDLEDKLFGFEKKIRPHVRHSEITWFNHPPAALITTKNTPIRAAIAHLYFESIHPFEDGNGRIGRAIAEKSPHPNVIPVPK